MYSVDTKSLFEKILLDFVQNKNSELAQPMKLQEFSG